MRWISVIALLWTTVAPAADVSITRNEQSLKITIDDEVFCVYHLGQGYAKPFMYPVSAPGAIEQLAAAGKGNVYVAQEQAELKTRDGEAASAKFGKFLSIEKVQLPWLKIADQDAWIHQHDVVPLSGFMTRVLEAEASKTYDHVHHKGIWTSIDEVNDIRYWAEKGTIRNAGVEVNVESGDPAVFTVTNHWLGNDEQPLLIETTQIAVFPNRLLSYDTTFQAVGQPVTFNDTKEGLFGIRLPNEMRESAAGGPVVGSNGDVGSKALWGRTMSWIDYTGPVAGRLCGVAIMDHPENFRPSRYHVRDYGLFSISPFGESSYTNGASVAKPFTLEADKTVRLRYGLYVHTGDTAAAHVADAYQQFVDVERK